MMEIEEREYANLVRRAENAEAARDGFEQDYREADEQRKAAKSIADRMAALLCNLVERPGERPSLLLEAEEVYGLYCAAKIRGDYGR